MVGIQAATGLSPKLLDEDSHTGEIQWRTLAPHIGVELADVLDQMVRYDFRARYSSAAEAFEAIARLSIPLAEVGFVPKSIPYSEPDLASGKVTAFGLASPTEPLLSATTAHWSLPTIIGSAQSPKSPSGSSQTPTEPLTNLQDSHASTPIPPLTSILLPVVAQLRQAQRRKFLIPLAGLVTVGFLVVLLRPTLPPKSPPSSLTASPAAPSVAPTQATSNQVTNLITQANQLRETDRFQEALNAYNRAIALDINSSEAYWGKCYSLNALEKPTEAIAFCDKALTLNADYPEALWSKGYALDKQQKHQEALKLYDRAIALRPDFAEAWSNKGTTLLLLKRPADALEAFNQATRLDPTLAEAWNNQGAALWSLRRFDEAIASVEHALQIQPNYQDAINLRKQMRQRLGR